jgi:hypothetical protein
MPGLIKIGYTCDSFAKRMKQLNTTGVPQPFSVIATFYVNDAKKCESKIHNKLKSYRSNKSREFFELSPSFSISETIEIILEYLDYSKNELKTENIETSSIDVDDIFFLQCILHDNHEFECAVSTRKVSENHKYGALELEYKMINLADQGLIKKVGSVSPTNSLWAITTHGIKYMFDNKHVLEDFINDERKNY